MKEEIKKLQNEELENVNGGSHCEGGKTYSSDTYRKLHIDWDEDYGQCVDYHPLITTIGNTCSLGSDTCFFCVASARRTLELTVYCTRRSEEVDNA